MYQVLARKYRPKNFHELVGQSHVSTALTNAIDHQRLHHAYLFTGTRGVGKTTIARILAKCLNCETGVTSEPCGVCSTCVAIDAGRFIDLIEIDAASRTKVEDTRELLDNVPYAPTQGRYKVYLIDEVHMLSTHSFNALLKTLEEPPEHVKFLLATTDPQKLPITIISRCLQFVLRPIAQTVLADYLALVLQKEQISATPDALWQLASSAKGSVRDALSLTDQAIAFGNGQIAETTVEQMLGLIDQADVAELLFAISTQNTARVGQMISQLREQVVDAKAVFDSLVEILHEVALLQIIPSFIFPLNSQQQQARQRLANQLSADTVQLYYEILVQSREKIALANTPLQALEMAVLRLLAFRPLAMAQRPQMAEISVNVTAETPTLIVATPIIQSNSQIESSISDPIITAQIDSQPTDTGINHSNNLENLPTIESIAENSPNNDEIQGFSQEITQPIDNEIAHGAVTEFNAIEGNTDFQPITDTMISDYFAEMPTVKQNGKINLSTVENTAIVALDDASIADLAVNPENFATEPLKTTETNTTKTLIATEIPQSISPAISKSPHNQDIGTLTEASPLALLIPPPQDLTGQWTPKKWDYWVYQAREHGWLMHDELVLAKRGCMRGDIAGQSEFLTSEQILANSTTFEDFQHQLATHFPQMQVRLTVMPPSDNALYSDCPEQRQAQREQYALTIATQKLSQTPVIQALLQENARLDYVRLAK